MTNNGDQLVGNPPDWQVNSREYWNEQYKRLNAKTSAPRRAMDARARELNVPKQGGGK